MLLVPCSQLADPPAPSAAQQRRVAQLLGEHTEALTAQQANLALLCNRQITQSQALKSAYDKKMQVQLQTVKQIQAAIQRGHEDGGHLFNDKLDRQAVEEHPAVVEAKIQEQLSAIQGLESAIKDDQAFWLSAQRMILKIKEISVQKTAYDEKVNKHLSDIQQFGAVISSVKGPAEWRQVSCILLQMSATLGSLQSLFASCSATATTMAAAAASKSPQRGGDLEEEKGKGKGKEEKEEEKEDEDEKEGLLIANAGASIQEKVKAADVGECENIAGNTSKLVAETFSSIVAAMRELQGIKAATKLDLTNFVQWESALPEWCTEPRESYLMQAKEKACIQTYARHMQRLGALPEEMPGEWIKLDVEELLMDVDFLRTVPAWIGELVHIKTLELGLPEQNFVTYHYHELNSIYELPDLGKLSALTSLSIRRFPRLRQLPTGLSKLKSLKSLNLVLASTRFCGSSDLKKLPDCIGDLASLETLVISCYSNLHHVPASIGKLKALTFLEISHCASLKKLPMAMAKLKALKSLKFIACVKLQELPEKVIASWQGLQTLHMKHSLPVIKDVSKLTALEELALSSLGLYSSSPTAVYKALIASTSSLPALKTLAVIDKLEDRVSCPPRGEVEVPFCSSLKKIHLETGSISLPAEMVNQLDDVLIRCGCDYKDSFSIEPLSGPGSIRITFDNHHPYYASGSTSLEDLPVAFVCTSKWVVKELKLRRRPALRVLHESLRGLTELQVLHLEECGQAAMLESLCECNTMTRLELLRCLSLQELPASFSRLGALSTLNIGHCTSLRKLPVSLKELTSITALKLQSCRSLSDVAIIGALAGLRTLTLADMKPQLYLPDDMFVLLGALEEVSVECGCGVLPASIGSSTALKDLHWHTVAVTRMPESIGNLTSLKSLHISNMCTKGVPASFERLTSLTSLKLEQRVQNVDSDAAKLSREQEVREQLQVLSRYLPSLKQLRSLTLPGVCQDDVVLVRHLSFGTLVCIHLRMSVCLCFCVHVCMCIQRESV